MIRILLSFSDLQSFHITNEFIESHELDPNTGPADVPESVFRNYLTRNAWRESHLMERLGYSDDTFRQMLARTQHSPGDPTHRHSKQKRQRRYPATVPSEDLVFTLECLDGSISFGRRLLMLLSTAAQAGRIDSRNCTIAEVRAIEDGAAR